MCKKFDEFSFLIFLTSGLEFFEFKSLDWLKHISHWLRERKYEDEKYWNGHLDKGYEPAFLPTLFFNKTKEEKEKLIKEMVTKPLTFIDELLENQFKEKTVLSDFIRPKLQTFRNEIDQKLKPFGLQMIKAVDVAEGLETILQYYNALWVGIWNGILEFIAGLFDLVGIIILILKQEVGFRITDALWQKIEKLFNFVYYDTQKFWDLILDKAITFVFQVYYLEINSYKAAKEIGELIPDIVTFAISWIKASKVAKAGSVAVAAEEIATKEALEKLEKESIEELKEKAVKEVEEKLDDLADFSKIRASLLEKWATKFEKKFHYHFDGEFKFQKVDGINELAGTGGHNHSVIGKNIRVRKYLTKPVDDLPFDALIEVRYKQGQWIEKQAKSSMFPLNWDITRVKQEVALVYQKMMDSGVFNKIKNQKTPSFKALDSTGKFEIKIEFD